MEFECSLSKEDKLVVFDIFDEIRFEINGNEPVVYLKKTQLKELISYLKKLEE